jgi:CRP/FNR family transcriptional regulator
MEERKNPKHCKDCVSRLPMFNLLNDEQYDIVNQTRCKVWYRPGETIFKQGTAMTHVTILTEGLVKIYLEGIDNRNLILNFAKPISLIVGPGFLTDYRHHFTTIALEETAACFIDVNAISEVIKQNKEFALEMLKWVNIHTQFNFKRFVELTQKGMHGRIAEALLYLHNDVFQSDKIEVNIKRQDLADLTAMSKESSIRILKELKDENIISVEGNTIILNDTAKLAQISSKG